MERLDHLLSRLGYASRKEARGWLRAGRLLVDGVPESDPSRRVDPASVRVDGKELEAPCGILVRMHKPAGHVCTHTTSEGPTVLDLLPERWRHRRPPVSPVGRLDKDTTGVLLLTDQGGWIQRWTSPRHKVVKVYEVWLDRAPGPEVAGVFASGTLRLDGEAKPCLPATMEALGDRHVRLELVEGRYHQVKRMFAAVGCGVERLHRVRFGEYGVADLAPGAWAWVEWAAGPGGFGGRPGARLDG